MSVIGASKLTLTVNGQEFELKSVEYGDTLLRTAKMPGLVSCTGVYHADGEDRLNHVTCPWCGIGRMCRTGRAKERAARRLRHHRCPRRERRQQRFLAWAWVRHNELSANGCRNHRDTMPSQNWEMF